MTGRILVADRIHESGVAQLRSAGLSVDEETTIDAETLKKRIPLYDGLVVRSRTKVTGEIIGAASNLKAIARAGAGLDNVDVESAKKRGIAVISSPASLTSSVAELAVGLMLSVLRKIPYADSELKQDRWAKKNLVGGLLKGKTVGVVGAAGRIGFEVATIVKKGFGAGVIGYDVIDFSDRAKQLDIEVTGDLNHLLQKSDIVTIHVPYLPSTHHLIDKDQFGLMKKGAILINTSRGDIINGRELLNNIKNGTIKGAGLDVFHLEPPQEDWEKELITLNEGVTVCTCHIGAQTAEAQRIASEDVAKQLIEHLKK